MSRKKRIIDQKWDEIFKDKHILDHLKKKDIFRISANEIRKYKEPRLMTKFDHKANLPNIFTSNNLGILPVTRGSYVIGHFNAYSSFSKKPYQLKNNIEVSFPEWIKSIDIENISSESEMINIASISGMFQQALEIDDNTKLFSTVNGRMSTGNISFIINGIPITVNNSQMEIDAGFEYADSLIIVEAKMHQADTFLIRQLYYPYKVWSSRINKRVIPIYLQYDNGIFNFSIFDFDDPNDYRSIKLVSRKNFVIGREEITISDLYNIYIETQNKIVDEPNFKDCPFPQANSLDKLLDIINYLLIHQEDDIKKEQLSTKLDVVYRQVDYYVDAGKYLGILNTSSGGIVSLTNKGIEFYSKTNREKLLYLSFLILQHRPFRNVFIKIVNSSNGDILNSDIIAILKNEPSINNSYKESVIVRRASTVKAWIKYIINSCDS